MSDVHIDGVWLVLLLLPLLMMHVGGENRYRLERQSKRAANASTD